MISSTTVKHDPSALAVTPTGGATHTITLHRQGQNGLGQTDPNANVFVYAEDTANALKRGQLSVQALRQTTEKVVGGTAPGTIFIPGQQRVVAREWYHDTETDLWYPIDFNVLSSADQVHVPTAAVVAAQRKLIQFLATQGYVDLVTRGMIN